MPHIGAETLLANLLVYYETHLACSLRHPNVRTDFHLKIFFLLLHLQDLKSPLSPDKTVGW